MTNKPECNCHKFEKQVCDICQGVSKAREFWIDDAPIFIGENIVRYKHAWDNYQDGGEKCIAGTVHVIEYSAYQELKEKLEIAKKALEFYADHSKETNLYGSSASQYNSDFENYRILADKGALARQALSELERKDEPKDYSMSVDCSEINEESIGLAKKNLMKIGIKDEPTK